MTVPSSFVVICPGDGDRISLAFSVLCVSISDTRGVDQDRTTSEQTGLE